MEQKDVLINRANTIINETQYFANDGPRVGGLIKDVVEYADNISQGQVSLGTVANLTELSTPNISTGERVNPVKGDRWIVSDQINPENNLPYYFVYRGNSDGQTGNVAENWANSGETIMNADAATKTDLYPKADKSQLSDLSGALTIGYDQITSSNNTGLNVYANNFHSEEVLGLQVKVYKTSNISKITVSVLDITAQIVVRTIGVYDLSSYADKEIADIYFAEKEQLQSNERIAVSGYIYFNNIAGYSGGCYTIESGVFKTYSDLLIGYKLLVPMAIRETISTVDKLNSSVGQLKDTTSIFGALDVTYDALSQKKSSPTTHLYANDFWIKKIQGIQYKVASGTTELSVERVNKYDASTTVIQVFDISAYSDKQVVNLYFDNPIELKESELIGIRGLCYFKDITGYQGGSFYIEGTNKGFYNHLVIGYKLLTDKIDQKVDSGGSLKTLNQVDEDIQMVKKGNLVNYPMFKYDFKTLANLTDFTNTANWALSNGLACASAGFSNYILHNKKITVEQRVTRVFATLYSDSNFALIWKPTNGWMGGGSVFRIDAANSKMHIHNYWDGSNTLPSIKGSADITVVSGREYILEAVKDFRLNVFSIIDTVTGHKTSISVQPQPSINGATDVFFAGGRQNNQFGFTLISGQSPVVNSLSIIGKAVQNPLLYIIGDSITEGDGVEEYQRYARLMSNMVGGSCILSGMSGTQIGTVIERLTVELPIFKPKYVMVTIGTNGGNTPTNLAQLVALIDANGSIPIINRIAMMSNTANTQALNTQIANLGVLSCRFDLATAVNNDPAQGQNTALYKTDLVHPNYLGHEVMANRLVIDVPELLEMHF